MLDDVTEWKSDRISQKVAGRRLYGMIYEIPLIVIQDWVSLSDGNKIRFGGNLKHSDYTGRESETSPGPHAMQRIKYFQTFYLQ